MYLVYALLFIFNFAITESAEMSGGEFPETS